MIDYPLFSTPPMALVVQARGNYKATLGESGTHGWIITRKYRFNIYSKRLQLGMLQTLKVWPATK